MGMTEGKAPYAWMLTYDHLEHAAGGRVAGPRNINPALRERLIAAVKMGRIGYCAANSGEGMSPLVEWFRMYDDDRELYYTGVRTGQGDDHGSEEGFEPLDDYGTPNAGATEIRYYKPETGEWETL
jgi:hypothetical protein